MNYYVICSLDGPDPWDWWVAEMRAANVASHREFVASLAERRWYDPRPILARAVNGVRLRYARRSAPRWRRGRWRMTG